MEKKIMWMLKSVLASYIVTGLSLLLLTFLVYQYRIEERIANYTLIGIYVLSTFVGGFIIGKLTKRRKFIWGIGVGVVYIGLLYGISFLLYKETSVLNEEMVRTILLCLGGGMFGGMMS